MDFVLFTLVSAARQHKGEVFIRRRFATGWGPYEAGGAAAASAELFACAEHGWVKPPV
jgi:hypothetical protein